MEWNEKAEIFIICIYIVIPILVSVLVLTGLIIVLRNFIKSRRERKKK
ncbi:hypothetical protein [Clostridium sp. YIM B02551]|nr:hypothetical protein [Clostridium sp. YIM B02551]